MSPERNFSFPKRKLERCRLPRRRRGGGARAPNSIGGRGFKWREPRRSLGRRPYKPQTALLRWSRAVGPSRCPAIGGSAHARVRLVAEWVFAKGARSEPSPLGRFLCHGVQYCTNTEIMHHLSITG